MSRLLDRTVGASLSFGRHFLGLMERTGTKARLIGTMSSVHVRLYRSSGGRFGGRPGAPTLLLTATGRKSGQPRTNALFYLPDGDCQVLCASYGGDERNPQWFQNLVANPVATVQIGVDEFPVRARVAVGAERAQLWPRVVANWKSYQDYQDRTPRELPLVVLDRG